MKTRSRCRRSRPLDAASWLLASLALIASVGCSKSEEGKTVGNRLDNAIAATEQKSAEVKDKLKSDISSTKASAIHIASGAQTAGTKVGDQVNDVLITTSINAELAKDATLSALKINVDTSQGRVVLHGTAPNTVARERASRLALSVKGVVAVDNQLTVDTAAK